MITRKAAMGFILLAIIVFSVASYDIAHPVVPPANTTESIHASNVMVQKDNMKLIPTVRNDTLVYKPPLVDFGDNTPIAMTVMVEAFALVCYLIAKRIEPAVIAWEKYERERVAAEQDESADDETPDDDE
jgi:hypothetical protein